MDSSDLESEEWSVSNITANYDDYKPYSWFASTYTQGSICIVYLVIFVFGLTGNLLVVHSVLRDKSKQTLTNVFIANLAVADILLCLFVVPVFPLQYVMNGWALGSFMCHLWSCVYYSFRYVSLLTLTSIALDRYSTVINPSGEKLTTRKSIIIIVTIWIVSISASLPFSIFKIIDVYVDIDNNRHTTCYSEWPSLTVYHIYYQIAFVMLLGTPMVVMVFFYTALSFETPRMSTPDNATRSVFERRTNRLLIAMTTVLCICWLPTNINGLLMVMYMDKFYWKDVVIVFSVFDIMALSSTCFNPLFYMRLNKIAFKQFCLVGPCCKNQSKSDNDDKTNATTSTVLEKEDGADHINVHDDKVNHIAFERGG